MRGEVVERAVARVDGGPVFLSVDVDVLDPAFAPGTGTPEPGGLTTRDEFHVTVYFDSFLPESLVAKKLSLKKCTPNSWP